MKKVCDRCKKEFDAGENDNNDIKMLKVQPGNSERLVKSFCLCEQCKADVLKWLEEGKKKPN